MKSHSLIVALYCSVAAASGAWAADDTTTTSKPAKPATAEKEKGKATNSAIKTEKKVLTGSYIKREFQRSDRITDGPNQVIVLDRETIDRTGAANLRQVLVRSGVR